MVAKYPKHDGKSTNTAFLLMFPAVILAGIAAFYSPALISFVCIMLALYQFIMLKKFIEDYYHINA